MTLFIKNIDMDSIFKKYSNYCRPNLAELLRAVRLDKIYHRAEGDYLYYYNSLGQEVKVIDYLGGYGASLFGHNNPDLLKAAIANYEDKTPFNSQASCRKHASLLSERLNTILNQITGKDYIITLASTGTECVEAAIKHAEMSNYNKIISIQNEIEITAVKLRREIKNKSILLSNDFYETVTDLTGVKPDIGINGLFESVLKYNEQQLNQQPIFLSLERSFHGKTTGSVKLTSNEKFKTPFQRIGLNVFHVVIGDIDSVKQAIELAKIKYYYFILNEQNEICLVPKEHINISALFIEPLQGEGGIHVIPKDFLAYCRNAASEYKFPLIFDEIQSGMGRTGTFMFSEQAGIFADYYMLSKSLGGGLSKISALLIQKDFFENDFDIIHTSTFAEDEHSARIAYTALDLLYKNSVMEYCSIKGEYLKTELEYIRQKYPDIIKDVRGAGLMIGFEFNKLDKISSNAIRMLSCQNLLGYIISGYLLHEHNIRVAPTLSSITTIRLEPSFLISIDDCNSLLFAVERLCEILRKENIYELTRFIVNEEKQGVYNEIKDYRKEYVEYINSKNATNVAFMGHFINSGHMILWDKGYENFTVKQLDDYISKTYKLSAPQIYDRITVKSETGSEINLNFIGLYLNSDIISFHMLCKDTAFIKDKIDEAVKLAADSGCCVLGFGGFTSIVSKNCTSIVTDSLALTSGNSLTVAMGIEAIKRASSEAGIDISKSCLAAIGAGGNICSIYSEIMAEEIPRIILIGRNGNANHLKDIASQIYFNALQNIMALTRHDDNLSGVAKAIHTTTAVQAIIQNYSDIQNHGLWLLEHITEEMKSDAPVVFGTDYSLIKEANLIVSASNSAKPVIFPEMLGEGPIVICDIAVPQDTDYSVYQQRSDVTIIQGGIVKVPHNADFTIHGIPLEKGRAFACMSETMLMGLSNITEDFSYGKIKKEQVKKIMEIAKEHGFTLAAFKTVQSY
ncbi:MAG: hypothetical protein A2176_07285 [Spirochaetes bacterium RBG_13_51_14]|nr:MAG: hypothetical protein A2176_07285 [Spirochaetes bacterium RBG_13_51_14]